MRSFLVTDLQAGKLPRWGLWLLSLLYIVPGLAGRDPWRAADALGFGVSLAMARGGPTQWLMPEIAGEPVPDEGPLPHWLAALAIRALPALPAHVAAQLAAMALLGLMFVALWYATLQLARQPRLLPADPFDARATPTDFGRAVADSALLLLMATIGLIAPLHENSADAAQLVWIAVFLFGAAIAIERPLTGGLIAGAMIAATVTTRGLLPAAALTAITLGLPMVSSAWRVVAVRWLLAALPAALMLGLAWPLALALSSAPGAGDHLRQWLDRNSTGFGLPDAAGLGYYARTVPWFLWPVWPVATWAILRWRGRLDEPALALPTLSAVVLAVAALARSDAPEGFIMQPAAALAMLAAMGLPTLRRSITSLIDWFAVMTYTLIGLAVWAYWLAWLIGAPRPMATSAAALSPGFQPQWSPGALALGAAATLAWLALVRWRVARHRPALWRPVTLSCGGLVLAWLLLMTLWLPAINQRNTYRELAAQIAARLPAGQTCITPVALGRAQRAMLQYFGGLPLAESDPACRWRIEQVSGAAARRPANLPMGWMLVWEGARPRDRDELLRLYRQP